MRVRLVAIDIDGTLLNSAKQITDATAAILRAARQQAGVHIVLATARPPRSVMSIYNQLELDTPLINYNGALVYDPPAGRVLMHSPIACKTSRQIIDLARSVYPEVVVSAEILDRWYTDRFDPAYVTETGKRFRPNVVAPVSQWLTQAVTKLLLLGEPEKLKKLAGAIATKFLHQVTIVQTEWELLQITHATVSKAQALRVVAAQLSVSSEEVMAIGDNANDVGMLKWAGIGVAMGNAPASVIAAADYVTDHHDADGAAKAIHEIIIKGLANGRRSSSY
ncbi:MAG: HAD family phosphatase [Phycisphaerae bacterium]|nr:HAD family phosphatase [Phycisphaerae bacterium]